MKVLLGNIRLLTKRHITVYLSIILVCFICNTYGHYLYGSVEVQPEFASRDTLHAIISNWEKLVESGMFIDYSSQNTHDEEHILVYRCNEESTDTYFVIVIFGKQTVPPSEISIESTQAFYKRKGLYHVLRGFGSFGECTLTYAMDSSHCSILGTFYNSDGSPEKINNMMQEIQKIVSEWS